MCFCRDRRVEKGQGASRLAWQLVTKQRTPFVRLHAMVNLTYFVADLSAQQLFAPV